MRYDWEDMPPTNRSSTDRICVYVNGLFEELGFADSEWIEILVRRGALMDTGEPLGEDHDASIGQTPNTTAYVWTQKGRDILAKHCTP